MLQPGTCSATVSVSSTWLGEPGAAPTVAWIQSVAGGEMFGPPTAAKSLESSVWTRK